eukprot:6175297-Pleurochrysis_carterae.AAC.1
MRELPSDCAALREAHISPFVKLHAKVAPVKRCEEVPIKRLRRRAAVITSHVQIVKVGPRRRRQGRHHVRRAVSLAASAACSVDTVAHPRDRRQRAATRRQAFSPSPLLPQGLAL